MMTGNNLIIVVISCSGSFRNWIRQKDNQSSYNGAEVMIQMYFDHEKQRPDKMYFYHIKSYYTIKIKYELDCLLLCVHYLDYALAF